MRKKITTKIWHLIISKIWLYFYEFHINYFLLLNCIYNQMTEAKKIADQKVIDDEVVGDFYENFDLIEKIYSDRQKTLQKTSY